MKKTFIIGILLLCCKIGYSQLNPMGSMYYQNQFLGNPAMAGLDTGFSLAGALKGQWTAIDGAPFMQSVTLDYGSNNRKIGLGLSLYNETAGVIKRTSLYASWAYHLRLTKTNIGIDFGLSGGFMDESVNLNKVVGDLTDVSLANFNQRKSYFDGDFGIAVRVKKLTIQGALPNLKRIFNRDVERIIIDRPRYFVAASYKFINEDKVLNTIEPKIALRNILNYKNIYDAGLNFQIWENRLLMSGIYHTTNSVTIGAGTTYKNQLAILCLYTSNTSDLQRYGNSEFEIALKYNFK